MSDQKQARTIGKYRIVGTLGRGSMGVVYKAEDPEIGRCVAIKTLRAILPGRLGEADETIKRFRQEARSAGNLRHPNIVTIFDLSRDGEIPYMVMDYLEGESLDSLIHRSGKLAPEVMVQLLAQIAAALDYAHAKGVIHRDIKPTNILIDNQNNAFILDFGVALFNEGGITKTDDVVGSPAYMSPEQILNQECDARSDLFSLAVVTYECLTGKRPFPGDNFSQVMANILNTRPIPITEVAREMPLQLEAEFERALARNKEARFASAIEMLEAFASALGMDTRVPILAKSAVQSLNRPNTRVRKKSSSNWRRVRLRRFSEVAIKPPDAVRERKSTIEEFTPWREPVKLVDQHGALKGGYSDSTAIARRETPGTSLFGEFQNSQSSQSVPVTQGLNRSNLLLLLLGGILVVVALALAVLVLIDPNSPAPTISNTNSAEQVTLTGQLADHGTAQTLDPYNSDQNSLGILSKPAVDPVPEGKSIQEMNDRQLLGVIVSSGMSDQDVLAALKEAELRKIPGLVEATVFPLSSDSYLVRIASIQLLGRLGDKRVVPYILETLDDHDPIVRGNAAKALSALADRRAVSYLSSRYTKEDEPNVKLAIRRAIERINGFPMKE